MSVQDRSALKRCPQCGQLSAKFAKICSCGRQFSNAQPPPQQSVAPVARQKTWLWLVVVLCLVIPCALLTAIVSFVELPVDAQNPRVVPALYHVEEMSPQRGQTILLGMDASAVNHKIGKPNDFTPHAFGKESDSMWVYAFKDRYYIILFRNNKVIATQDINEDGTWHEPAP